MKAVFFDFDGTLTHTGPNIWQEIWAALGYKLGKGSEHQIQLEQFLSKEITYQEWCDKTLACYKFKGMTKTVLDEISSRIRLLDGAKQTFEALKQRGFELHVISGNIVEVIKNVLGENIKYFDSINANDFVFDENEFLINIIGTKYDCEGKAKFIEEYITKTGSNPKELYFVGNGFNDEWAHLSGCTTICVNPDDTDAKNTTMWHNVLNIDKLTELLPYLI